MCLMLQRRVVQTVCSLLDSPLTCLTSRPRPSSAKARKKGAKFAKFRMETCPEAGLVKVGTYLYRQPTANGGANNDGVIFQITTTGIGNDAAVTLLRSKDTFASTLTHVGCCLYGVLWAGEISATEVSSSTISAPIDFSILHEFCWHRWRRTPAAVSSTTVECFMARRARAAGTRRERSLVSRPAVCSRRSIAFSQHRMPFGRNGLVKIGNAFYGSSEGGGTFGGGALFQFTPPSSEGVICSFQGGSADGVTSGRRCDCRWRPVIWDDGPGRPRRFWYGIPSHDDRKPKPSCIASMLRGPSQGTEKIQSRVS